MPELPNLEGQPGWVIVVVVALFVGGSLMGLWLRRQKNLHGAEPERSLPAGDGTATVAVPGGGRGDDVLQHTVREAMKHLADVARREAEESEQARREADKLRDQLGVCSSEVVALQVKIAQCEGATQRGDRDGSR